MTDHPITPPPELVSDWCRQWARENDDGPTCVYDIATQAARWGADQQVKLDAKQIAQAYQKGADQELEACCKWLRRNTRDHVSIEFLRAAMRPKPPSLKELALDALKRQAVRSVPSLIATEDCDTIRRALEQLDD